MLRKKPPDTASIFAVAQTTGISRTLIRRSAGRSPTRPTDEDINGWSQQRLRTQLAD
jgi:hypothetical protein